MFPHPPSRPGAEAAEGSDGDGAGGRHGGKRRADATSQRESLSVPFRRGGGVWEPSWGDAGVAFGQQHKPSRHEERDTTVMGGHALLSIPWFPSPLPNTSTLP